MGAFNTFRLLCELRKNQWLETLELKRLQEKKLRAIVRYAYNNVPFYYNKFRKVGLTPDDIQRVEDLQKVPLTTKSEIRKNFRDIISRKVDVSRCRIVYTGGSTGVPLKIVYDEYADDYSKAVNLRSLMENGLKFTSRWVEITNPTHIIPKKWFQHFGILSPRYISTQMDVKEQVRILRDFHPEIISGFSSSLFLIAKEIKKLGVRICPVGVFGTGDTLDRYTREFINSVFGVEMVDLFGCVELNRTAWECDRHEGYHMDIDSVVIEFIKDGKPVSPGERGEIVYTCLYNYAMPLIRYAIEDIGIPAKDGCSCGRGLPLMESVEGRKDDFVITSDGRTVSPRLLSDLMKDVVGLDQYKIVQETPTKVIVQLVKGEDFSQNTISCMEKKLKGVLGDDISIKVEVRESIPKEPSGKLRKIVSKVNFGLNWAE